MRKQAFIPRAQDAYLKMHDAFVLRGQPATTQSQET